MDYCPNLMKGTTPYTSNYICLSMPNRDVKMHVKMEITPKCLVFPSYNTPLQPYEKKWRDDDHLKESPQKMQILDCLGEPHLKKVITKTQAQNRSLGHLRITSCHLILLYNVRKVMWFQDAWKSLGMFDTPKLLEELKFM